MSIVIKGMEVPQNCAQCFLRVGGCKERIYMETRPKRCPIEPLATINTDTISRQAAVDAVYLQSDDDGWWCGTAEDMETLLKGLPSAQPEQKTGRWIKLYPRAYKCSECKSWWEESEVDEIKEFTYCPKCGAKMEEDEK